MPSNQWLASLAAPVALLALSCEPSHDAIGGTENPARHGVIDPGSGGSAGTGGTPTGGAGGAGGGAGTHSCGGGGAPTGELTPCELAGPLDGRLVQFPCTGAVEENDDCLGLGYVVDGVVTPCGSEFRFEMVLDHPLGGTRGARYLATMHFYGIMEPKYYGPGATREAAPARPDQNGGDPVPWATAPAGATYPLAITYSYEIHVHDHQGRETARYYVNANTEGSHTPHFTFLIDYEKTIEVVGGGFVRLRTVSEICRHNKNCGTTPGYPCASKARTIDLSAADPPPPPPGPFQSGGFNQPGLNHDANHGGQWWFIDVTAVQAL